MQSLELGRIDQAVYGTYSYECDIIVLRGAQPNRQDPVGDGALDDSSGHDATLRSMYAVPGRVGGVVGAAVGFEKVADIVRSRNPLSVLEDVRLKRHGGRGVEVEFEVGLEAES